MSGHRAPERPSTRASLRALAAVLGVMLVGSPMPTTRAQQAAPPVAQPATTGGAEPIEIVADDLVVTQEQRIATFTGNVDAVQGDVRLRADELKVFYNDDEQQAAAGGQQVRLLEARGNVILLQRGDTAEGDRGTYLVAERKVTMDGQVVLTRGGNVVRGARLESDLETGVSRVLATRPGAAPGQRVRAVFSQQPAAGAAAPARPTPRAAPAGGGS